LRHTAASFAIASGANVKAVQRMLGHASAAITLDVYADLFDDDLDTVSRPSTTPARNQVWQIVGKWRLWRKRKPPDPLKTLGSRGLHDGGTGGI
jgi:hypothetical protein